MYTPRINWILLILFGIAAIVIFVAALILPPFRAVAYAPMRELVLPPPAPVVLTVLYSTEKQAWLEEIVPAFEASGANVNGHPIKIEMEKMGSWEMNAAVLDGTRQPVIVSPASSLQIVALVDDSTAQYGRPLVNPADTSNCRPVVRTPLVFVAWKERADVLWGKHPRDCPFFLFMKASFQS